MVHKPQPRLGTPTVSPTPTPTNDKVVYPSQPQTTPSPPKPGSIKSACMSPKTISTMSPRLPSATKHISLVNQLVHVPPRVTHSKNGPGTNSSIVYSKAYGSPYFRSLMDASSVTLSSIPPHELKSTLTNTFYRRRPVLHTLPEKTTQNLSEILSISPTHPIFSKLPRVAGSARAIVNLFGSDCESLYHTLGYLGPTCIFR